MSTNVSVCLLLACMSGCVTAPASSVVRGQESGVPAAAGALEPGQTRIIMNVKGGYIRELNQAFAKDISFKMRITEEHGDTDWSPVVGVCMQAAASEEAACMQFIAVPSNGPAYLPVFYSRERRVAPREHQVVIDGQTAGRGDMITVTVKQVDEQLVFTINGKDETFPIPFKANVVEYSCSSAVCEFRD
ncbi:MAG: hypothetical protein ACXU8N_09575 [Telluria sp.]